MHAFLLLLGDALAQAPQGPPAPASASTWLNLITACVTALGLLATATLSILKMLDKAKIRGLEKERAVLTDVVTAIGEAVDEVKPILSSSDAKEVTGAIQRHATAKGVLLPLDTLLADKGLNQEDRGALGQAPPPPPAAPPSPIANREYWFAESRASSGAWLDALNLGPGYTTTRDPIAALRFDAQDACASWIEKRGLAGAFKPTSHLFA